MSGCEREIATRKLKRADVAVPILGFGGASVGNLYRAVSDASAQDAMATAIDCGVRYFDTAPFYGHGLSETRIGAFISNVHPQPFLLSTKVGRVLEPAGANGPTDNGFVNPLPFEPIFDYSYDGVMRSFEQSCSRLMVDAVDILYMHDIGALTHGEAAHPSLFRHAMDGGLRAMEELKSGGAVRAIGLGVNEWEVCQESFAYADFDVFMLAGRYTILEQEPLDRFLPECVKRGVGIVIAAPFNSGLTARRPDASSKYNYAAAPQQVIARAEKIFDICEAHHTSTQAIALKFPLAHPAVVSVVTGMSSSDRVRQTCQWFNEPVPTSLWADLKTAGVLRSDAPTPKGPGS